jgi:hypothetical protein
VTQYIPRLPAAELGDLPGREALPALAVQFITSRVSLMIQYDW